MTITAAVDGSSLGNPGPGGWAWAVSADCWDAGGWPLATNNLGELTAVLELLRATAAAGRAEEPLHVLADSQYAINTVTKWRHGWKKRGWQKADKKPIANLETIQAIDHEIAGRTVTFEWVKGHAGHPLNEFVDDRARGAAEAFQAGRPAPSGPGFTDAGGRGRAAVSSSSAEPGPNAAPGLARSDAATGSSSPSGPVRPDGLRRPEPPSSTLEPGPAPDRLDLAPLVVAAEKRFIRAWIAGDTERLSALAAPGARRVWPDGVMRDGLAGPTPVAPRIGRITAMPASAGPGADARTTADQGANVWLTTYTMRWDGGASTESGVWVVAPRVRVDGDTTGPDPRLFFHQSTVQSV